MLSPGKKYDFDFDHEFLESETWEAKPTYKGFMGYGPECAVLTDTKTGAETLSGIENRFLPTLLQNLLFADFRENSFSSVRNHKLGGRKFGTSEKN